MTPTERLDRAVALRLETDRLRDELDTKREELQGLVIYLDHDEYVVFAKRVKEAKEVHQ